MMLAKGSLMVLANRSRIYAGGSLKNLGSFPTPFQVFTYFRLAASRRYADHGMVGRSAMKDTKQTFTPRIPIAVRAWNEEAAIRARLDSLLQQSLFEELSERYEGWEVLCIAGDRQYKHIGFKNKKSLRDRISLATADMARTIAGQITPGRHDRGQ